MRLGFIPAAGKALRGSFIETSMDAHKKTPMAVGKVGFDKNQMGPALGRPKVRWNEQSTLLLNRQGKIQGSCGGVGPR